MRCASSIAVLVLLASLASAQANLRLNPGERSARNAETRQVVGNYCRLDYDGARIAPEGWARMQPLTTLRENPEFKRIAVVIRYQVVAEPRIDHGHYIYDVEYDVSGEYDLSGVYFIEPTRIASQVEVADVNGDLRVVNVSGSRPFVGRARFEQWLQSKVNAETDPVSKSNLESSLQRFQAQEKKPIQGQ
jgi:hypothetical protein